ncbi:uncharacterized protein LOC111870357 isoform X4 [Cryptotermes secundus]|uniref:uncharacterized protein LOC111870357 isoform X4 n=1 Tax=Cryptotermes secundus TaxID=105785 RepID=UPI000CD7CA62|nr:uncharacterized protein LOC111870357 isoform X4 [Cryptotermes secundus]
MTAPTANNHSWFNAKNEGPGHQEVAHNPHLYNRNLPQHVGPPSDQAWQSQYQWYTPASKPPLNTSHQMNSGTGTSDSWNWGGGTSYQQQPMQYGQQLQQNSQQYFSPYRNHYDPSVARPYPDPWNWGWEESGISENSEPLSSSSSNNNNNNNINPDPAWRWSVENTATYQEHNIPSTNAGYSSGQHGQNYTIAPVHATFNTGPNTAVMTPGTAAVIAESFGSGSADQTALFHSGSSQHLEGNRNPFTPNYVKNNTVNHPVITSDNQYATISTASNFDQGIYNHGSHGAKSNFEQGHVSNVNIYQQETCRAGRGGEGMVDQTAVTKELKNVENIKQDTRQLSLDYVTGGGEFTNVPLSANDTETMKDTKEELDSPANDVPELSTESSSREQDTSKQSFSAGNDGLSSQWSTESLPSSEELSQTVEGNEIVSSHPTVPQSHLVTNTLQVNEQNDQYQNYEPSTYEFNDVKQGDSQAERADQVQSLKGVTNNTSVSESRNLYHQDYQNYCTDRYAVEQTTNETVSWNKDTGNRGCSQVDTNSNAYGHLSVGSNSSASSSNLYVHGDLCTTQTESMTIKTALSVESVSSALDSLTISNENFRSPDVENKEIIYPELEDNSGALLPSPGHSNQSFESNVNVTPPPAVPGHPPKSIGITQGRNSKPYSLNQKHTNKYQTIPPSGEGATGVIEHRSYSHLHLPSVGPIEPGVNISQFTAIPEIMSHTVNNLMQPTYSHKAVEAPGSLVSRKKKTPPPPMTEDAVNLETVPDNKERPDFIDVPQTAPVTRPHTAPVGQDSLRGMASQWTQPSSYSTSPENQEVAPRCGPDRNQYLETGQLSSDEREIRSAVPDVMETQYRISRNGNSSVSSEGFSPLLGLRRMIPGQITDQHTSTNIYQPENVVDINCGDNFSEDISTPPPGLHRMVPGQFTENENSIMQVLDSAHTTENSSGEMFLDRMVPGQLTEESVGGGSFVSDAGSVKTVPAHSSVDDIPPPGLRRMVPGESSSPESQGNFVQSGLTAGTFQPIDAVPLEPRVVTGVAQDEMDGVGPAGTLPLPPSPMSASSHAKSEPVSPLAEQALNGNSLPQPPSERSETIGSDGVEVYPPPPLSENTVRDASGSRREAMSKDRERWHRDDEGNNHNSQHQRRQTDRRDHYSFRDKERAESPGTSRYKDREEWDWKYDSRHERDRERVRDRDDSSSGGRYRDDRHYDPRKEFRSHDDNQRPRRKTSYDRQEDDADTEDYFSDHDHDKARHRDNYDSRYRDRADRERGQREIVQKISRERKDHRATGRDRDRDRDQGHDRGRVRDRERRRQEYSDRHDYRRFDEHYSRGYEDDAYYRDNQRSRPSSQTEYEEYHRRNYHGYGAYNYGGRQVDSYHYDPYDTYKYYEYLCRTDPAAYADWYAKYYPSHQSYNQGTFSEDRGSVHSGRSSANEKLHKERYERTGHCCSHDYCHSSSFTGDCDSGRGQEQTDSSVIEDPTATTPQRLTPAKFSTAHVKGILTARGQVVKVLPPNPLDGQPATVEIHNIQDVVSSDETVRELQDFPGPLIRGVTHKNSVITYCMRKLKKAESDPELFDRESVILLWKLLILLLRQNGAVVGADIAGLLLSKSGNQETVNFSTVTSAVRQSAPSPAVSQHSSIHDVQADEPNLHQASHKSEEELVIEFTEYLLYGNKREALELAVKHGLWGHAIFLASKMDQRTYANVMMRFVDGLAMNNPLQTLHQLMSGHQPAAVTCCADEKWGDWKPHLAMILSNPSQRPDLDQKAVVTLGDTLRARGCLHASHFCYLMAQLEFGLFSRKSSKIVLLGSSHLKPFVEFATNEAIQMTEIYIYGRQLAEHEFNVPQFQAYKYLYATRLAEFGMLTEAVHYVEVIAGSVLEQPTSYSGSFAKEIYDLGDQLKYCDPLYSSREGETVELADPSWLRGLHNVIYNYNIGLIQQDIPSYGSASNLSCSESEPMQHGTATTDSMQDQLAPGIDLQQQQQESLYCQDQQTQHWPVQHGAETTSCNVHQQQAESSGDMGRNFQNRDQYWADSQWGAGALSTTQDQERNELELISAGRGYGNSETQVAGNVAGQQPFSYWNMSANHTQDVPQVTLPGSTSQMTQQQESSTPQSKPSLGTKSPIKQKQKEEVSKHSGGNRSLLGVIWNRFVLRPANQMKLPDDKNPSIVWDPDKKKWTNVDGDDDNESSDVPPPPKDSELPAVTKGLLAAGSEGPATGPSGSNVYRLNGPGKGRKPRYVNVLEGSKTTGPSLPAPDLFPPIIPSQTSVNYFVPSPVESSDARTDFLTPATSSIPEQSVEQSQLSRWSSTSSLSREVQKYTMRGQQNKPSQGAVACGTPMTDPASFVQNAGVGTSSNTMKRYPN